MSINPPPGMYRVTDTGYDPITDEVLLSLMLGHRRDVHVEYQVRVPALARNKIKYSIGDTYTVFKAEEQDRTVAQADTLGMREENGYMDKGPSGMTKPQEAVQDFLAKHAAELEKLQNVIKSLTAQNNNKQGQINELRVRCKGLKEQNNKQGQSLESALTEEWKHRGAVQGLRDQIAVQAGDGNWDYDEYMRGMLNGMLCAMSNFDGMPPPYKEALPAKRVEATKSRVFNLFRKITNMSPGTAFDLVEALADEKLI